MNNKEKTAVPSLKNSGTVVLGKLGGKRAVGLVLNHYQMDNEVTLEKKATLARWKRDHIPLLPSMMHPRRINYV
ncbi:hypothetical protein SAMN00768000_0298 [Sulfobacillus thermosulfidooxidans DSM 9293]|uniref:Uncharacterized protein n=1 Tax=Sulfobacillus thermosulfidooxidans (strain DSM 9293 / VKM B-1269 / AT-1) TaxID=929705 RepID=A0A1W1W720_SULTA|nr:hypothetical protein [Sulfobacillus thermosulfidooxidans]SMC02087.1 hypothetical protein SAMN00768000_0298 [Sulfobacillus thermosulfidooxidans DSM 9293]